MSGTEWYDIKRLDDGITLIRESHIDPFVRCNIWHVRGRDRLLALIDDYVAGRRVPGCPSALA